MAKKQRKQNKKQKNQVTAKPELSIAELESKFHRSLESFAYRPAIKYAKELHRLQPEKYQTLLIKALQGLHQELISKKQNTRAEAILVQIKDLGDSPATDILELSLALQSGIITPQHKKLACLKIEELQSDELANNDKNIVINILLGATTTPEYQPEDHFSRQLYNDIIAVRSAFELICDKQYDTAMNKVSGIKRSSLLAPWRLLLKGITSFYLGEDEKALTAFKKIPPESTPKELAKGYLFLLEDAETSQTYARKEPFLQTVALLATPTSDDPNKLLARAEILWKTGRYRDSFQRIKPLFNDLGPDTSPLKKRLLRFYCNGHFAMTPEQQGEYLRSMSKSILSPENQSPPLLKAAFFRIVALYQEESHCEEEKTVELWDQFLDIHTHEHPDDPAFKAAIYAHQADIYAKPDRVEDEEFSLFKKMISSFGGFGCEEPESSNHDLAEKLYQKALKSDPDNLEINLKLLQLFETCGSSGKSKRNRLMDQLIRKFPDNKETLLKAGIGCLERKAFPKGLKYLYQAANLDPTDNKTKEFILIGSINYGWKLAISDNQKRYRDLLHETLPFCVGNRQQFNLSPGTLRARWAVLELVQDNLAESREQLDLALNADKGLHSDEVLYFFRLYAGVLNLQHKELQDCEKKLKKIFSSGPDLDRLITFSKIILYNIQVCGKEDKFIDKEVKRLNKALAKLTKKCATADQCLDVVNFTLSPHNENSKLALSYLRQGRKICPDDLQIWLLKLSLELENARPAPSPAKMEEIDDLIEEALETNNHEIAQRGEELIETYHNKIAWFRDVYDFEENDLDDEPFELLPPGASKPPKNWPRRRR